MYYHNRLQAREPQRAVEITLGGQRSTGKGRQVDLAGGLWLAAGIFYQTQSDLCSS